MITDTLIRMDSSSSLIITKTYDFYKCQYGRVELLNDENFPDWQSIVTLFLIADKTWNIVNGTERAPRPPLANASVDHHTAFDTLLLEFQARATKACAMIVSSVSLIYKQFINGKTDP